PSCGGAASPASLTAAPRRSTGFRNAAPRGARGLHSQLVTAGVSQVVSFGRNPLDAGRPFGVRRGVAALALFFAPRPLRERKGPKRGCLAALQKRLTPREGSRQSNVVS